MRLREFFGLLTPIALLVVLASLAALNHEGIRAAFSAHGWDRAIEVESAPGAASRSPAPADVEGFVSTLQNKPFSWGRIVSAPALEALRNDPLVESVHRYMPYTTLADEQRRQIAVLVVDRSYIDAFGLGSGEVLSTDLTVAATSDREADKIRDRYPGGTLVLKPAFLKSLPADAQVRVGQEPPAVQRIGTARLLPRPHWLEERTQFYVSEDWVNNAAFRSGLMIGPLELVVKLRPEVDIHVGLSRIQSILDRNPSPLLWPGDVAKVRPLLDGVGFDKTRRAMLKVGRWIPAALGGALALIAVALLWLRFRALRLELALRRSFGQPKWHAALQTLQPQLISLGIATAAACLIAWAWFAVQGHPWAAPKLWPAAWAGVAIGAALALLLARAVVRKPAALLLKAQLG